MSLGSAPLPLVDVAEQERRLALDVWAFGARRGHRDLLELLAGLLQPAEHHHDVCTPEAKLERLFGMRVAKHVERARVVPLCLVEAFPPLGAPRRVRKRSGRLQEWRLDRAAGHLAGEAARLLEMPGDDLDELVGASGQDRHPVGEADMELGASAFRNLPVRDVAHQDVLERVLVLARDASRRRCAGRSRDARASRGPVGIGRRYPVVGAEVSDGAGPEDRADDGCVVCQLLVASFEPVEPRADQALDARRHR